MPSYKNFWSLNVDEAIVAGKLQAYFKKSAQVFFPLNAQLKDIDLLLASPKKKRVVTIQVKGSKAHELVPSELKKYNVPEGSVGWFFIPKSKIRECQADFIVLLIHTLSNDFQDDRNRRTLSTHLLTIRPDQLDNVCRKHKILHRRYSFYIWIDPQRGWAFDFRDARKKGRLDLSKHLDENGLQQIRKQLRVQ